MRSADDETMPENEEGRGSDHRPGGGGPLHACTCTCAWESFQSEDQRSEGKNFAAAACCGMLQHHWSKEGDHITCSQATQQKSLLRGAGVIHDGVAWHVHGVGRVGIHRVDPVVERDVGPFGGGFGHSSCGLS